MFKIRLCNFIFYYFILFTSKFYVQATFDELAAMFDMILSFKKRHLNSHINSSTPT